MSIILRPPLPLHSSAEVQDLGCRNWGSGIIALRMRGLGFCSIGFNQA